MPTIASESIAEQQCRHAAQRYPVSRTSNLIYNIILWACSLGEAMRQTCRGQGGNDAKLANQREWFDYLDGWFL